MGYRHIDDKIEPYLDILIDCIKLNGADIEEQVKRITSDTDTMGECLEENFLAFKLHSKKVRDEYEKAVSEELSKMEKVWEKCDELLHNSKPTVEKVANSIASLRAEVNAVNSALDKISVYKAERLIELVEKFNAMSDADKEIFSKLLEASKEVSA